MIHSVEQQGSEKPEVILVFWIIKIAATTLGETFGDTVTMTLNWGFLVGTTIFFLLLIALVIWQITADRFHPFLSWAAGTLPQRAPAQPWLISRTVLWALVTQAGRPFCWSALSPCLACGIGRSARSLLRPSRRPRWKFSTWAAILRFPKRSAQRLATGRPMIPAWDIEGGALVFAARVGGAGRRLFLDTRFSVFLFWPTFLVSRPLGATVGDFLDKPVSDGGLALSRPIASAVIAGFIIACLVVLPQRAGQHPGRSEITPCKHLGHVSF